MAKRKKSYQVQAIFVSGLLLIITLVAANIKVNTETQAVGSRVCGAHCSGNPQCASGKCVDLICGGAACTSPTQQSGGKVGLYCPPANAPQDITGEGTCETGSNVPDYMRCKQGLKCIYTYSNHAIGHKRCICDKFAGDVLPTPNGGGPTPTLIPECNRTRGEFEQAGEYCKLQVCPPYIGKYDKVPAEYKYCVIIPLTPHP